MGSGMMSTCLDLGFNEELQQLALNEGENMIKSQLKQTLNELTKLTMDYEAALLMIDSLRRENEELSAINMSNCAQLNATNAEMQMLSKDIVKYKQQIVL